MFIGKLNEQSTLFNICKLISPIISNSFSFNFLTPGSNVYYSIINFNTSSEK